MRYVFGVFELDEELFELRRAGQTVHLRPQALDVLIHLARHRDRVVTKDELLDAVWDGAAVSETALAQAIVAVRRALDDDAQRIVQTVRSRGYRFVAALQPPDDPHVERAGGSSRRGRALVGRDKSVAALEELLSAAEAGRGGVALVVGDAGVGKTRLLDELSHRARARGLVVVSAACDADEGAPELWPFARVVQGVLDGVPPARRPELASIAPDVAGDRASAEDRFRLFDRLARFLHEAARELPLLVVIDDVQWADAPSLLFLKFAARELASSRALVVASCRDAALAGSPVLARTLGALARADARRCVELGGLTREEIARLAEAMLGRAPSEPLLARLHEKTGGNPLVATQMLRFLAQSAASDRTSAMIEADGVREAVGTLVDGLSPDGVRALAAAAVLGREFAVAPLAAMCGTPAPRVLELLEEARRARVVAPTRAADVFRFVHALVRDVLHGKLTLDERARLHAAAAEALALRAGDAAQVARHFMEALPVSGHAGALLWSVRAARAANGEDDARAHLANAAQALARAAKREVDAVAADALRDLEALADGPLAAAAQPLVAALRRARS